MLRFFFIGAILLAFILLYLGASQPAFLAAVHLEGGADSRQKVKIAVEKTAIIQSSVAALQILFIIMLYRKAKRGDRGH